MPQLRASPPRGGALLPATDRGETARLTHCGAPA